MDKKWLGIAGTIAVILVAAWLLGGGSINCRDSFWDKDKKVIEINHK